MDTLAARLEVWSDRLNPILVRETRQRIKGKFFPATFLLLVGLSWLICVGTVLSIGNQAGSAEIGPRLLSSLMLLLGIPLCYAAPLNLFRSIAQEFDGQTFEVLAVTTLSPVRIVFGKLQSCLVEIGAYACAVAPFICFSYLLRGVSIYGLIAALAIMHFAGAISSVSAMLLGAVSKQSFLQALSIILLMIVSTVTFSFATSMAYQSMFIGIIGTESMVQGLVCFALAAFFGGVFSIGVAVSQFTPTRWQPAYMPPQEGNRTSLFESRAENLANPFGSRLDEERRRDRPSPGNGSTNS